MKLENNTTEERYEYRIYNWGKIPLGKLKHRFWWVFHNLFVHVLLGIFPIKPVFKLHDWASTKLNNGWLDNI